MLTISRMKSLITTLSPITPAFSSQVIPITMSKTTPFAATTLFSCLSSPKPTSFLPPSKPIGCYPPIHQTRCLLSSNASPPPPPPSGQVHVIVGPMFAGKTTSLLRRVQAETDRGSLKGLCFTGRTSDAVRLLWGAGLAMDHHTYALLLQECIFRKEYVKGRRIHAQMVVTGHVPDEYLKTKLLILYAKSGDLRTVHVLFNELKEKTLISWNALVAGNVAIIKSNKDTRYGLDSIVTHDGVKLPCWALSRLSSFKQTFGSDAYKQLDVIGIDEAQFFDDLYDFCREVSDHDGKTVIVAGLDGDYLRRNFGSVLDIIPLADSVTKLTARCEICGERASFTLRKTEDLQTELIGGADVYMPVCRQHYVSGQVAVETARVVLESQKVQCSLHA
ncbi:hypothetical protein Tsubulata_049614 [Turnera subulata]|uniref:thymidine kinase n=1 Tax=Turnera subulata TaxID=218843 RepID=A0A9Q0J3R3_9ROSI|nr:hypothetical protein Tsubulata_049614 [Turnera subulata]